MTRKPTGIPLQFTARGNIPRGAAAYALRRVEHVLGNTPGQVLHAQVILSLGTNPAQERPARVEVCFDVNGKPVRAHVAASDLAEATDLAVDRLQRRLVQLRERTRTRHRWLAVAAEHENSHRSPTGAPAPVAGDRPVIRRKTFTLEPMTPDEAAYEMDLLDHDFYLFTDAGGADAVMYRTEAGGHGMLGPDGVPVLSLDEAKDRLGAGHERFVFYRDPDHHRGRVLYVRRDGRYGLLVPSPQADKADR